MLLHAFLWSGPPSDDSLLLFHFAQSLTGHTTPVESVKINTNEELIVAGSQSGSIRIWDLEAAKSRFRANSSTTFQVAQQPLTLQRAEKERDSASTQERTICATLKTAGDLFLHLGGGGVGTVQMPAL